MLKYFKRKKVRDDPEVEGENSLNFSTENTGLFCVVWEKKRMPSPGAMAYAFESLGLVEFAICGRGTAIRSNSRSAITQPFSKVGQPAVMQAVPLQGTGTVAGQIFGQALFDPSAGYTAQAPIIGAYDVNIPYQLKRQSPYGGAIL